MIEEVAVGLKGTNCSIRFDNKKFEVEVGEFFKEWLSDNRLAKTDFGETMPLNYLHIQWMHDKLDEWIRKASEK